jgi:hypothetical protein
VPTTIETVEPFARLAPLPGDCDTTDPARLAWVTARNVRSTSKPSAVNAPNAAAALSPTTGGTVTDAGALATTIVTTECAG